MTRTSCRSARPSPASSPRSPRPCASAMQTGSAWPSPSCRWRRSSAGSPRRKVRFWEFFFLLPFFFPFLFLEVSPTKEILSKESLTPPLQKCFQQNAGLVQSAFLFGYAATQLVGGAAADKYGGRRVLGLGIAFFSLAQLATPALLSAAAGSAVASSSSSSSSSSAAAAAAATLASSRTLAAALFARAAVGLGEGVALPSMSSLVARHVPPSCRATALGASFSGFHCGNLVGLALSPVLLARLGWRGMFAFFGAAGAPLLLFWLSLVPESERVKKKKKKKEKENDGGRDAPPSTPPASTSSPPSPPQPPRITPRALLSSRHTWAIIVANVANHWGYFVYLSWLPSYFHRALGLDLAASAAASLCPWALMAAGSSASGALADWLVRARRWPVRRVRVTLQLVAFLVPAAALVTLVLVGGGGGGGGGAGGSGAAAAAAASRPLHPALAIALVAAALGTTSLGQAGFVANMADVAPRAAGAMFGLCNTFGSAAGIAGVVGAGAIVQATGGSFAPLFLLTAGLYCVGAAVFATFASGEAVF